MAKVITFPLKPGEGDRYREEKVIGAESGITVRILSRIGRPHDLIVVLDGTFEGTTTVASLPAGEFDLAEVTANSILATLEAAEITWHTRIASLLLKESRQVPSSDPR